MASPSSRTTPKTDMLETDVRSLIRPAVLHDVAIACNRRSADLMISSPLLRSVAIAS